MSTFVLVHGAWHTGRELEPTAELIAGAGHRVFTPTTKGNGSTDSRDVGLPDAIESILEFLVSNELRDVVLTGHSFGGMVITGVADRAPERIRRLVYWNAFVPNDGESVNDMLPPEYVALFDSVARTREDGAVVLPFPVWREAFMNDADLDTARRAFSVLNPQPVRTLRDKIPLKANPAQMPLAKSFINCTEDISLPHHYPWHPRLSQKLGLFRLIQTPGGHELLFSNPAGLASAIMDAGRD